MKTSEAVDPPSLIEVIEIKKALGEEVAHLPLRDALRETVRRASEEAAKQGYTERAEIRIGTRLVPIVRRPEKDVAP